MSTKSLSRDYAKWQLDLNQEKVSELTVFRGPTVGTAASAKLLRALGFLPGIAGAETGGYQTQGDIVQATADGIDLNALWAEFQQVLDLYNAKRAQLVGLPEGGARRHGFVSEKREL